MSSCFLQPVGSLNDRQTAVATDSLPLCYLCPQETCRSLQNFSCPNTRTSLRQTVLTNLKDIHFSYIITKRFVIAEIIMNKFAAP